LPRAAGWSAATLCFAASEPSAQRFRRARSWPLFLRSNPDVCRPVCVVPVASGRGACALRSGRLRLACRGTGVLGIVLFCLGFPDQALAQSGAEIAEARRMAHPPSLAVTLTLGTILFSLVGDNAVVGERADQLVALATEQVADDIQRSYICQEGSVTRGILDNYRLISRERDNRSDAALSFQKPREEREAQYLHQ
jgi:hypothetical protein